MSFTLKDDVEHKHRYIAVPLSAYIWGKTNSVPAEQMECSRDTAEVMAAVLQKVCNVHNIHPDTKGDGKNDLPQFTSRIGQNLHIPYIAFSSTDLRMMMTAKFRSTEVICSTTSNFLNAFMEKER